MKSLVVPLLIVATCIGVAKAVALIDRADADLLATPSYSAAAATTADNTAWRPDDLSRNATRNKASTMPLGEFARCVQAEFRLPQPSYPVAFADVRPNDPNYAVAEAIYPYLHRRLLCPECAPSLNFSSNSSLTRVQSAMVLVSILTERDKVSLLDDRETEDELADVADAGSMPAMARPYVATAIKSGILTMQPGNTIRPSQPYLRADLTAAFGAIERQSSHSRGNE